MIHRRTRQGKTQWRQVRHRCRGCEAVIVLLRPLTDQEREDLDAWFGRPEDAATRHPEAWCPLCWYEVFAPDYLPAPLPPSAYVDLGVAACGCTRPGVHQPEER